MKWQCKVKEKNIIADVGNTDEKYRFALESALKPVLNNLLIESIDDIQNAILFLKQSDLGKASFYLLRNNVEKKKSFLETINNYSLKRKIKRIEKENIFLGWAKDFVESDKNWKPYFNQILAGVAITKDLNDALVLQNKFPDFSFTTLDGDIIQYNGIIEAGSLPKQDETIFGRKQLLENLKKEFPKHEAELELIRSQITETENKIAGIDLKNISDSEKLIANDIANIEKQLSQLNFEHKKADEEIEIDRKDIQEYAEKSNLLHSQLDVLQNELDALNGKNNQSNNRINEFEKELGDKENDFNIATTSFNESKLELERLRGRIQNTKDSITRSDNDILSTQKGIEKREFDLRNNAEESDIIESAINDEKDNLENINAQRSLLTEEERKIDENLKQIKEEASRFEKELNQLRNNRQEISDKIHSLDIKENEINYKLEGIVQHIKENYSVDISLKHFEDLDSFNYEETTSEVQKLKEKLRGLGPVNLLAYSEYEEEKKRLDFLHQQRNDLVESEKDLIKTINEINDTAQNLFAETFEQIRLNFIKIFQTLFNPGDEADLTLEENVDPLEARIEIMAKPKGKRPTSIELLSGGEKTLTATALLFAIYLVKPSPFCILDEVDAPLDDANIDRFTKLLLEFSSNTQFIIVTHNKRTMESAQTMYGVTMQEEGVSKLVGVRFEEIPDN